MSWNRLRLTTAGTAAGLVLVLLFVPAEGVLAQSGPSLEGVWGVSGTPRDCTTGAQLAPPIRSVVTFHQGGTLTQNLASLLFAPGQRAPGQGTWTHAGGATYRTRILTLIVFDTSPNTPPGSPGFKAGWIVEGQTLTMSGADRFTGAGTVEFYDVARQLLRVACGSSVGERFK